MRKSELFIMDSRFLALRGPLCHGKITRLLFFTLVVLSLAKEFNSCFKLFPTLLKCSQKLVLSLPVKI